MKFKDIFDAVSFLGHQGFLSDEKVFFSKDVNTGRGEVTLMTRLHEASIDVPAEDGRHVFRIAQAGKNEWLIYCNDKLLNPSLCHEIFDQDE